MGVFVEQCFRCDQEAGSTDSTLQGCPFQEAFLYGMEIRTTGNSFHRFDFSSFHFGTQYEATVNWSTVEHDGTGSTVPIVTAFLGTSQSEIIPKDFQ
tara:strand:- start:139 stop:429 length:291 start_codon:yes stop_codon:yes gene_type:complete